MGLDYDRIRATWECDGCDAIAEGVPEMDYGEITGYVDRFTEGGDGWIQHLGIWCPSCNLCKSLSPKGVQALREFRAHSIYVESSDLG